MARLFGTGTSPLSTSTGSSQLSNISPSGSQSVFGQLSNSSNNNFSGPASFGTAATPFATSTGGSMFSCTTPFATSSGASLFAGNSTTMAFACPQPASSTPLPVCGQSTGSFATAIMPPANSTGFHLTSSSPPFGSHSFSGQPSNSSSNIFSGPASFGTAATPFGTSEGLSIFSCTTPFVTSSGATMFAGNSTTMAFACPQPASSTPFSVCGQSTGSFATATMPPANSTGFQLTSSSSPFGSQSFYGQPRNSSSNIFSGPASLGTAATPFGTSKGLSIFSCTTPFATSSGESVIAGNSTTMAFACPQPASSTSFSVCGHSTGSFATATMPPANSTGFQLTSNSIPFGSQSFSGQPSTSSDNIFSGPASFASGRSGRRNATCVSTREEHFGCGCYIRAKSDTSSYAASGRSGSKDKSHEVSKCSSQAGASSTTTVQQTRRKSGGIVEKLSLNLTVQSSSNTSLTLPIDSGSDRTEFSDLPVELWRTISDSLDIRSYIRFSLTCRSALTTTPGPMKKVMDKLNEGRYYIVGEGHGILVFHSKIERQLIMVSEQLMTVKVLDEKFCMDHKDYGTINHQIPEGMDWCVEVDLIGRNIVVLITQKIGGKNGKILKRKIFYPF